MFSRPLVLLAFILSSTGCATQLQSKVVYAASLDFPCDESQIKLDPEKEAPLGGKYLAYGCGWEAVYEARCGLVGCGASTSGRLDANANAAVRNDRLSQLRYDCNAGKQASCVAYERESNQAVPAAAGGGGHRLRQTRTHPRPNEARGP